MKVSLKTKQEIFKAISSKENSFDANEPDNGLMAFLENIWDLKEMPSTDGRFNDAAGDIYQHTINNNDWDYDYLFLERLKLFSDDKKFKKFIETLVDPRFRKDENDIFQYSILINSYLEKEKLELIIIDYNENDLPINEVKEKSGFSPVRTKINNIPFYVLNEKKINSQLNDNGKSSVYPCFILEFNNNWNDYSLKSEFRLTYYKTELINHYIGEIKIMKYNEDSLIEHLEETFTLLDDSFCSLGQSIEYYNNLKNYLGKDFESVLWSLKDSGFYTDILEKFENTYYFKNSIIRGNSQERLLREAKYLIYDYDLSNLYSFKYNSKPKFAENTLEIDFDFKIKNNVPNRIYTLIGKNGTGKTQLITTLPLDISKNNHQNFVPKIPLFSKVIAVSYSIFDKFEIPKKTESFNYVYCGLKDIKGEVISERRQILRFHNTWKKIQEKGKMEEWKMILDNFLEKEIIEEFIVKDEEFVLKVDLDGFGKVRKKLSSGQTILLYIITEIFANIRYDSLIIYDEPETHLHPNAISQLINTIYDLVNKFQSYCIIATHSPLIVQEILSKNVYVVEKQGKIASVRKIGKETFGENLTVLTEEIFGNRAIPKQYEIILSNLVDEGLNYEEIKGKLESDNMTLSLNAILYLKTLLNEKS